MTRRLLVLLGTSCLLFAQDAKQKVRVVHTERVPFPPGGLLRVQNSLGDLSVEGWDRPDAEITTIKATADLYDKSDRPKGSHKLDQVRISTARQGGEVVVTTAYPSGSRRWRATGIDLEYHIKVPMSAKLAVRHGSGEVHVDNLTSDMVIRVLNGGMTLFLPPEGSYGFDAKSDIGEVISQFPGRHRRLGLVGHRFMQASGTHQLHLRASYGDIMIFKIQKSPTPSPITQ